MNWDRVEGEWKQKRGKAMQQWGKIMNDELAAIAGRHENLVGKLQERYGIAKDNARLQDDEFKKTVGQLKKANRNLVRLHKSLQKKRTLNTKPMKSRKPAKNGKQTRTVA